MTPNTNIYSLIMAGGGGTRFWPLSRQSLPKQLLNLSGNDVMINETIKRCSGLISIEDTFIVTNVNQVKPLENVLLKSVPRSNILAEPLPKNTAPCLLYASLYILETRGDGVICIFPSDHYITETENFKDTLRTAIEAAATQNTIVTLGVKPTNPSTGYGYIKICEASADGVYSIEKFVEKPNIDKANEYLQDGSYYWNAGIFICKASVLAELFNRFLPKMSAEFDKLKGSFGKNTASQGADNNHSDLLKNVYENIDAVSIDYGVMERVDKALMVKGSFDWNDIGSWDAIGTVLPKDENGNVVRGEHTGIDTKDCVIYGYGKKSIATIGIKDLVVVDTADALLICEKERAQDVRKLADELAKEGKTKLL